MKIKINGGQVNGWIDIATEDGDQVCKVPVVTTPNSMGGWTTSWAQTTKRADQIVAAVNSFDALVAVAKAAQNTKMEEGSDLWYALRGVDALLAEQARASFVGGGK